jgi:hypothetical protein
VITDNVGKDDTFIDDTGMIAQLAYGELLRAQKTSLVGTFTTPMIKDLLPGEFLHLHARKRLNGTFAIDSSSTSGPFRVPLLTQNIVKGGFTTTIHVTNDVTNSRSRNAFTDMNTVMANMRPEFQNRQATNIKAGTVDVNVPILETDYPT